ncbi:MAG: ABC transporter permease [Chitinophagaceae bacterium]|nr:ABC transporter permease [Chitinophagaceae bacterium]
MFKNYFKTAWRHLWRHRLFTVLNIFGLAVSISACWIIYRIVSYEFSYDRSLPNNENTYKVITAFDSPEKKNTKSSGVAAPLYKGIREEIPGIANVVPVFKKGVSSIEIKSPGKNFTKEDPDNIIATDASYFNMLPYQWIAGSRANALNSPGNVVLTESRAREYFPGQHPEDILNKTIVYYEWSDTVIRTVTGIVADYATPSQFTYKEFVSLPKKEFQPGEWTNTNGSDQLFIQLNNATKASVVLEQINALHARKWQDFEVCMEKATAKLLGRAMKMSKSYELLPVQDVHFATDAEEYGVTKTSKPVMYGLGGIAFFLLLLACINYINMSAAQIPKRGKEIGVRKTLGSSRNQLINQFLFETFSTTVLACLLSVALSNVGFGILKDIIPEGVTLYGSIMEAMLFMLLLAIIITILAGIYPGWLITKLKAVNVFKNFSVAQTHRQRFGLQKALIVFQFIIALVLITSSIIVGSQLRYTLNADMGFNKDAVVLVNIPWKYGNDEKYKGKQFTLLSRLQNEPGIEKVALGSAPLSPVYSSSPFVYEADGKEPVRIQTYKKWCDTSYLNLYRIQLLAGSNLRASDTVSEYLINESAAKAFGFSNPQDAVGKMIGQLGYAKLPVTGVIKDFNTEDFYTQIKPLAISNSKNNLLTFNIKLNSHNPAQWQRTLKAVEKEWYHFYPAESFHFSFYDETIEKMYMQERQIGKLIDLSTIITILISCLGLFGLAALTAFQRTKEIGIRKVLGASVSSIIAMFSKEHTALILLAMLISTPVAWWAMNKWLQDFAYKIDIHWWMFALAGLAAIVIALITVSFQAIKAAMANPVKSLRAE